jgi:hypothetical protein
MKHLMKKSIIPLAVLCCMTSKVFAFEVTVTQYCIPTDITHYVCHNNSSIRVEPMLDYEIIRLPGYIGAVTIKTKGDYGPVDIHMECIYGSTVIEKTDHSFSCRGTG